MVNKNLAFSTNRLIKKYGKVLLKVQYEVINPNIKMFFVSRVWFRRWPACIVIEVHT